MTEEQEDQFRLRKADDFVTHCRESENQARLELARAVELTRRAKEKYETLFMECERRARLRSRTLNAQLR
ncbi:hypothetical protein OpiT1DRAFT_05675 [Opitutaceae bacterium TAV1]|nr:hypothetical protein OpiT1DRAFT_05675 [Opitutaceae bacterium TAV1]